MSNLVSSLISDPLQSHMALSIAARSIDAAIFPIDGNGPLISRHIDIDADSLSALEDTVYNNPLLLSDFGKIDVLIDTMRFMVVPDHVASSSDLRSLLIDSFWPGEPLDALDNSIAATPYTLLAAVDRKLLTFIRRTFSLSSVKHRICPFLNFCVRDSKTAEGAKMYLNLHANTTDIVYLKDGELIKANTFATAAVTDTIYYVMLMASTQGFDYKTDELVLCGDSGLREELMPELRKYIRYVMPEMSIATRYGTQAIDLQVPFELLCLSPS